MLVTKVAWVRVPLCSSSFAIYVSIVACSVVFLVFWWSPQLGRRKSWQVFGDSEADHPHTSRDFHSNCSLNSINTQSPTSTCNLRVLSCRVNVGQEFLMEHIVVDVLTPISF